MSMNNELELGCTLVITHETLTNYANLMKPELNITESLQALVYCLFENPERIDIKRVRYGI